MSLEFIKEQLSDFISSTEPEVMAIQGEWGIGKTYTWNTFLKDNKDKVAFNRYSYVSLFGINSLDSLKYSILRMQLQRNILEINLIWRQQQQTQVDFLNRFLEKP
ncbi:P-loop NTPase fold protein [Klebsiella pneumoniae]